MNFVYYCAVIDTYLPFVELCFFAVPTLFSASDDNTVKQWNLDSNSCLHTFQCHFFLPAYCLAVAVNAFRLLSGDAQGSVLIWDGATGQQMASVKAHSDVVSCLAVTPDDSSFVSGSWDYTLKLWQFKALQQPVIQFSGHTDFVKACVVSSDGSRLYSCSYDTSIRVWEMTSGQQLTSVLWHTLGVNSLALSGSMLVSGSYDNTVKLGDTGSMRLLHTLRGHSGCVFSVAVVYDGSQRVLSGGGFHHGTQDYSVRVWDASSGAQLAVLQGHLNSVRCITASSNGRFAASASADKIICVWDLASLSLHARLEGHESCVTSLVFE